MTTIRRDRFGRIEVSIEGKIAGRILPRNCGTWAAAPAGENVAHFSTRREAIEHIEMEFNSGPMS